MTQPARALMVLGTASHVGKSLLTAALCRILRQDGFSVAPFKAQNMSLNSAATPDGFEIGRAQAVQAEACGIAATREMNPVLIKPSSDTGAQVIVRGRVWGQVTASDYHRKRVEELFPLVVESYQNLAAKYDFVVLEGAGSPAEINLKARDITNLRMAAAANARCVLVGDIDRGGVFAALYGTLALLEKHEQNLIRGFIINKFRGDQSLLQPGIEMIETKLEKPCVGVIPHLSDIGLEEEDSVSLGDNQTARQIWNRLPDNLDRPLKIGVVALPSMSNFTDFDAFADEPAVSLAFVRNSAEIEAADVLILPGSKQTIADLNWLKANKFDAAIARGKQRGALIVGVCGGMQMLGRSIRDVAGLEGGGAAAGLGLLDFDTILTAEKITVPAHAELLSPKLFGVPIENAAAHGYEIHLGETVAGKSAQPLFRLIRQNRGEPVFDGATSRDERTFGTYLHGVFDADDFRHEWIRAARQAVNLNSSSEVNFYRANREAAFDRLAAHVRQNVDVKQILSWF